MKLSVFIFYIVKWIHVSISQIICSTLINYVLAMCSHITGRESFCDLDVLVEVSLVFRDIESRGKMIDSIFEITSIESS